MAWLSADTSALAGTVKVFFFTFSISKMFYCYLNYLLSLPAADRDQFSIDPVRIFRGQENSDLCNIRGLPNAAQRCLRQVPFFALAAHDAGSRRALRFYRARIDGIDTD